MRFAYEWHDAAGQWYRSYGNENWRFDADGYMAERHASINDVAIEEAERLFRWPHGPAAARSIRGCRSWACRAIAQGLRGAPRRAARGR